MSHRFGLICIDTACIVLLMETFSSIIGLWPSAEQLAADLNITGQNPGVTVRAWKRRDSIPPEYWNDIVAAAESRGFEGITLELLASIAASNRTKSEAAA